MAFTSVDFGSKNTGALINVSNGQEYATSDLIFVHQEDSLGMTKQPTVFWIHKNLLSISSPKAEDIRIYSCVFYEDMYADNPNFIWSRNQIKKKIMEISKDPIWVRFDHPKMEIYRNVNGNLLHKMIKGSDGNEYLLKSVLTIFFTVIRMECIHRAKKADIKLYESEIQWAVTVPGLGIWNQEAVIFVRECAAKAFGENVSIYTEPECALVGSILANNSGMEFVDGRVTIVGDLGGGTSDTTVMREKLNDDGTVSFEELKATPKEKDAVVSEIAGGNDVDRNFYNFFCRSIAGDDLDDAPAVLLWTDFVKENPKGAFEFEDNWHRLYFSPEINGIEGNKVAFCPGREYLNWLKRKYPKIAEKNEYGFFIFNKDELHSAVFEPVYQIILKALEEVLVSLCENNITPEMFCFAGGLSLDVNLKAKIKSLVRSYFNYIYFKETSTGATIGAIQRGANHIAVNKETLIRRMARKYYYTELAISYNGDDNELKNNLLGIQQSHYHRLGTWLKEEEFEQAYNEQKANIKIDYGKRKVTYLVPVCLRFAPVTTSQSFIVYPFNYGQTGVRIYLYSSNRNLQLFPCKDGLYLEGEFNYDFGYQWETAELDFDPASNAVEGQAVFSLCNSSHQKLYKITIDNVSKRGL